MKARLTVDSQEGIPVWQKVLRPAQQWEDKDDLLDVLYWLRQILSIVFGVTMGLLQLTGFVAMTTYVALTTAAVVVYVTLYQKVDTEELGGLWEVAKEGFMSAYALFLISWIVFFTAAQDG